MFWWSPNHFKDMFFTNRWKFLYQNGLLVKSGHQYLYGLWFSSLIYALMSRCLYVLVSHGLKYETIKPIKHPLHMKLHRVMTRRGQTQRNKSLKGNFPPLFSARKVPEPPCPCMYSFTLSPSQEVMFILLFPYIKGQGMEIQFVKWSGAIKEDRDSILVLRKGRRDKTGKWERKTRLGKTRR